MASSLLTLEMPHARVPEQPACQSTSRPQCSPSTRSPALPASTPHDCSLITSPPPNSSREPSMPGAVSTLIGHRIRRGVRAVPLALLFLSLLYSATSVLAQQPPPELTQTVNDFTGRVDAASAQQLDTLIRS